jgi:hypothetical protein
MMHWRFLFAAALGLIVPASIGVVAQHETKSSEKTADTRQVVKSLVVDGFQLFLTIPKTSPMGMPFPLDLKVRGQGNDEGWININNDDLLAGPIKLTLKAKDGPTVPYTLYGKSTYAPEKGDFKLNQTIMSVFEREMAPCDELDLSIPNLALIYDLTIRRKYVLSIAVQVETSKKSVTLETGPIEFEIDF